MKFQILLPNFLQVGSSVGLANRPESLVSEILQEGGQNSFSFRPYSAQIQFLRKCAVKALGEAMSLEARFSNYRNLVNFIKITVISGYFTTSQSNRLQELTLKALDESEIELKKAEREQKDPKWATFLVISGGNLSLVNTLPQDS